jgi:hypothetical protein
MACEPEIAPPPPKGGIEEAVTDFISFIFSSVSINKY